MSAAIRPIVAAGAVGAVLLTGGCARPLVVRSADESAAVRCKGSVVEVDFDPEVEIEVRTAGETVTEESDLRYVRKYCVAETGR